MQIKGFQDTLNWYEKNSPDYLKKLSKLINWDFIDQFISLLPPKAKILDAGCAGGRDSIIFHQKGFKIIGIDLVKKFIDSAKKDYPDIEFIKADFRNLPFENNSFDGIWASCSLLHFEEKEDLDKSLLEFKRILKPDGIIFVLVKAQMGEKQTDIVKDSLSGHNRFFRYYQKEQLEKDLEKYNFKILDSKKYNEKERGGKRNLDWIKILAKLNK